MEHIYTLEELLSMTMDETTALTGVEELDNGEICRFYIYAEHGDGYFDYFYVKRDVPFADFGGEVNTPEFYAMWDSLLPEMYAEFQAQVQEQWDIWNK